MVLDSESVRFALNSRQFGATLAALAVVIYCTNLDIYVFITGMWSVPPKWLMLVLALVWSPVAFRQLKQGKLLLPIALAVAMRSTNGPVNSKNRVRNRSDRDAPIATEGQHHGVCCQHRLVMQHPVTGRVGYTGNACHD